MANKISNFVFLILLFFLQSCSGGRLGNFLESSFMDNNSNKISPDNNNKKFKSDMNFEDKKLSKKKDKTLKTKSNDDNKPLNISNSFSTKTNDANLIKEQNQIFNPKSYKVFVILKKVDPSSPTEKFSKALRNGDINFEIERIELIPELNQNKK